jgi:hypothetical protein
VASPIAAKAATMGHADVLPADAISTHHHLWLVEK